MNCDDCDTLTCNDCPYRQDNETMDKAVKMVMQYYPNGNGEL